MHLLLFTGKVAFLCNLFFVLCMGMRFTNINISQDLESFIIIVGWILSALFNLLFFAGFVTLLARRKTAGINWVLAIFNLLCLPLQVVFIVVFSR